MDKKKFNEIDKRIKNDETRPWGRYPYRALTLAKYLAIKKPSLDVRIWPKDITKDSHISGTRLRRPGTRDYKGIEVTVKDTDGRTIIRHDTTETYRENSELAAKIRENIL